MLARGIRSYHRPTRLEEALALAAQGVVPLAGGTRLLASDAQVPNILDLAALDLGRIQLEDGDLLLGAMVTLQDVIDSPLAHTTTCGLLPAACRAQFSSRMLREMATLGGESVHGAHDADLLAALLALNAVYLVSHPNGPLEIPAVRFLRRPAEDLAGGGLLTGIMIPGAPQGAALERASVWPSTGSLLSVAVAVAFVGEQCSRARIALTGLSTPPARILEAEARIEGTTGHDDAVQRCIEQIETRAHFRDDAHASASYRRRVAGPLAARALRRALGRTKEDSPPSVVRPRPPLPRRAANALPYFTSGRVELTLNGTLRAFDVEARTSLLDLLRRERLWGAKQGCGTGDCGACTVLMDGRPVASCLTLAARAQGHGIVTVESLGDPDRLHPIQTAFIESGAIQCGFCTPAMELCGKALIDAVPDPSEAEVRDALAGCLCCCTGYMKPVDAVLNAAKAAAERRTRRASTRDE